MSYFFLAQGRKMPVHILHHNDFFTLYPLTGEVTDYDGRYDARSGVTSNSARVRPSGCANRQRKASEFRSLQDQNASLVRQVEALTRCNDVLTRSNGHLSTVISKSTRDIADLTATVSRLEAHNASLVSEISSGWYRVVDAQRLLIQQEEKADALLDQLRSLARAHEDLKASASASERAASQLAARDVRIAELENRLTGLDNMIDRVEYEVGQLGVLDELKRRLLEPGESLQVTEAYAHVVSESSLQGSEVGSSSKVTTTTPCVKKIISLLSHGPPHKATGVQDTPSSSSLM